MIGNTMWSVFAMDAINKAMADYEAGMAYARHLERQNEFNDRMWDILRPRAADGKGEENAD